MFHISFFRGRKMFRLPVVLVSCLCAVAMLPTTAHSQAGDERFEEQLRQQAERELERLESSREWFEANNIPFPTVEDIIRENRGFLEDIRRSEELKQLKQLNQRILQHLDRLAEDSEHFASVMLSPDQREELEELQGTYHGRLRELVGAELAGDRLDFNRIRASADWHQLDHETRLAIVEMEGSLRDEVLESLLPHQLQVLANTRLAAGLPRVLTESPIGNVLELTDEQRRNIQRKSEALAVDIEKMVRETRQRAFDLVGEELTAEQKEQLFEMFGRDKVYQQYSSANLLYLFGKHKFELPEDWDGRKQRVQSPMSLIWATGLDDEKWKTERPQMRR